jgi:type I restriction enzyme S subunit
MTTLKQKTKFKETEIGFIPEEWEIQDLGSICQFNYGKSLTETKRIKGKIPVYGSSGITGYHNESLTKGPAVIIARKGSIGNVYYEENNFWPIDTTYYISGSTDYHLKFLYYLIQTLNFETYDNSSAVPGLNREDAYNTQIPIPPLSEQKQIAEILSSLDEKIELNRRMNKTLEEIGKGLFKRWFVDFEFPNEDGKPYKSSGGKMVDSELGEIPEGWVLGTLEDIADVSIGRTPPRKESIWFTENPRDIKWISIKDLGNSGVFVTSSSEYLTSEAVKKFKIPVIPNNTIVISFKLTVGRVAITVGEMLSNEAIAHVKLQSKYSRYNYFLYHYLKSFDYSSLGSTSSIATAVNSQSIKQLSCLVPEPLVIQKFNNLHAEHFELILSNTLQIENLISLRENLLPKLISGRIRTI